VSTSTNLAAIGANIREWCAYPPMRAQRGISGERGRDCSGQVVVSAALDGGQYEIGGLLRVADEGNVGAADLDRVRAGPGCQPCALRGSRATG
jgi:hypothetical protein